MAAGDYNVTAKSFATAGHRFKICGDAEVDGTLRAFDMLAGRYIIPGTFQIQGYDDAGAVEVNVNENASGTEDFGNVSLRSSTEAVNTYNWSCEFI